MGPLVPDVIGTDLNLIAALVIGILFGAILEQAGFSTSKKLVGLFYGYDFTVLRVFFTAGVTAMIGVIAFDHFGLLDVSLIFINPTFFWSAVVGGLIMGLGFVIGGFCPGTSVAAAGIGKIDAMIFLVGAFIGVFIFAEGYPFFEGLYKATNWGSPRIFESLGLSQGLFAFLLTLMALGAFYATTLIENKVNGAEKKPLRLTPYFKTLGIVGTVIALSAFILPERKESILSRAEISAYVVNAPVRKMTVDEFAYRLMEKGSTMQVIDFRSADEYQKMSLPKSTLFTVDNLFEKEPNKLLTVRGKINVFVAENEGLEQKFAYIASELGYKNIVFLEGGLQAFRREILEFKDPGSPATQQEAYTYRFRTKASKELPVLIANNKSAGPVEKKQKRIIGGC